MVVPGNLCKRHLHNWEVGIFSGKHPHIFQISDRIPVAFSKHLSPPVHLPYHLVKPAKYDMDVGGVELAFAIEAVAHEVAVDGHPRERGLPLVISN